MTKLSRQIINFLDDLVDAHVVISEEHHAVHEGLAYVASGGATLALSAVKDILIATPNDAENLVHLLIQVRGSGESNVLFYEAPTTSVGTPVTPRNRNRNASDTTAVTVLDTPTVTAVGTLLLEEHFGSGRQTGGETRSEGEFVLKPNTKYLIRITSEANGNDISWHLHWYTYNSSFVQ